MSIGTVTDIRESDPSYVISDGHHFIGAMIRDKNNFNAGAPFLGIEGSRSGKTTEADRRQDSELPKPQAFESKYPGRIETLLSLFDRWGSCIFLCLWLVPGDLHLCQIKNK